MHLGCINELYNKYKVIAYYLINYNCCNCFLINHMPFWAFSQNLENRRGMDLCQMSRFANVTKIIKGIIRDTKFVFNETMVLRK